MAQMPVWLVQLNWSRPRSVQFLNKGNRNSIPEYPGVYAITGDPGPLAVGRVLYIGETGQMGGLRARLSNYLVDYRRVRAPQAGKTRREHKGKGFVLEYRSQRGDHAVFVRWAEYGGSRQDRLRLEASLIHFYNPSSNDRDEDERHVLLGDDEAIDPRLLG